MRGRAREHKSERVGVDRCIVERSRVILVVVEGLRGKGWRKRRETRVAGKSSGQPMLVVTLPVNPYQTLTLFIKLNCPGGPPHADLESGLQPVVRLGPKKRCSAA